MYGLLSTGSSTTVIGGKPWYKDKDATKLVHVTIGASYDYVHCPSEMASEDRGGGQKKVRGFWRFDERGKDMKSLRGRVHGMGKDSRML